MITFSFENGAVTTLRTSGTEPKVKYYAEMCASPQETYVFICDFQPVNLDKKWIDTMWFCLFSRNWHNLREILHEMIAGTVTELLQPEKHNLTPQSDK